MYILPNPTFANAEIGIYVNEREVELEEPLFIDNDRVYVPIRFISEQLNATVTWDGEDRSVKIVTLIGDQLTFYIDSNIMKLNNKKYIMDVAPTIQNSRTYLPVRHVSEFMHSDVMWDAENNDVYVTSVETYSVQKGDTLSELSEEFNSTVELLEERNGLKENEILVGTDLKVIIPQVLKVEDEKDTETINEVESHPDLSLLAKLIHAEAEAEPYSGKIAVGNVVMNRVNDSRFPNTIRGVIYQENQFTPVKTGRINGIIPDEEAYKAAKAALAGERPVKDALFFFNPSLTNDQFLRSKPIVAKIGNHQFSQ